MCYDETGFFQTYLHLKPKENLRVKIFTFYLCIFKHNDHGFTGTKTLNGYKRNITI